MISRVLAAKKQQEPVLATPEARGPRGGHWQPSTWWQLAVLGTLRLAGHSILPCHATFSSPASVLLQGLHLFIRTTLVKVIPCELDYLQTSPVRVTFPGARS